jgi:hypothetical protein
VPRLTSCTRLRTATKTWPAVCVATFLGRPPAPPVSERRCLARPFVAESGQFQSELMFTGQTDLCLVYLNLAGRGG